MARARTSAIRAGFVSVLCLVAACASSGTGTGTGTGTPSGAGQGPVDGGSGTPSATTAGSSRDCAGGADVTEENGITLRSFCGPATATVVVDRTKLEFASGAGELLGDTFTVNLGTFASGGPSKPDYFGLTAFGATALPLEEPPAVTWVARGEKGSLAVTEPITVDFGDAFDTVIVGGKLRGSGDPVEVTIVCG